VVNVATNCGDVLTPLHLQARVTGVVMYTKLTTTTDACITLNACTTLVYIKKHKLGLYVRHATTPPWLKCTCTPPQWSLGENLYSCRLYLVILYSILAAYKSRAGFSVHKCERSQSDTVYTSEVV